MMEALRASDRSMDRRVSDASLARSGTTCVCVCQLCEMVNAVLRVIGILSHWSTGVELRA